MKGCTISWQMSPQESVISMAINSNIHYQPKAVTDSVGRELVTGTHNERLEDVYRYANANGSTAGH